MISVDQALDRIRAKARPDQVQGMARYGMTPEGRLGVSVPDMRQIAHELGRDHQLARALWETRTPEAQMVAGMIADPRALTEEQMEDWVQDLKSWDVCDQACMNLFEKTPLAWRKITEWSEREEEFVKRAAFALLACLAWHDKRATDEQFSSFLPLLQRSATDERNYVKKAVNWALRNIGKRNVTLNKAAIDTAQAIQRMDSRSARWIATDALRELQSEAVQGRLMRSVTV